MFTDHYAKDDTALCGICWEVSVPNNYPRDAYCNKCRRLPVKCQVCKKRHSCKGDQLKTCKWEIPTACIDIV